MNRTQFTEWAKRHGYTVDRYGHLVKSDKRLKLSSVSVRLETRVSVGGKNEWIRLKSGYLSKLSLTADDKLSGLSY